MNIELHIEKYIADPYRIELFNLIEIQKQSGMMRARSDKKRRECLESHLHSKEMTYEDYMKLEKQAKEPFYINEKGFIFIPERNVFACLANANDEAPSKLRIANLMGTLRISNFITNKKEPDGVWERFVVVKSGTGQSLSNQRGKRINHYVENLTATGSIDFNPDMVTPESITALLEYAGRNIGIGSSRKMGYGRFKIKYDR